MPVIWDDDDRRDTLIDAALALGGVCALLAAIFRVLPLVRL
jgi:hypothetical protein